jgi:hypothetical protein
MPSMSGLPLCFIFNGVNEPIQRTGKERTMIIVNTAAKAFIISKKREGGKPPLKWVLAPGPTEVKGDDYKALKAHAYFKSLVDRELVRVGKTEADANALAAELGLDEDEG